MTVLYIIILAIVVLGPIALLTYNLTLHGEVDNLNTQISALQKQKSTQGTVSTQAAFLEDRINSASSNHDTNKWDEILDQIAAATPINISLTDIKMAEDTAGVTKFNLTGATAERRAIVLFADKLNENKGFESATIDNIAESSGTDSKSFTFTISFNLKASSK